MDKVRKRGLVAIAALALAGAVLLGLALWVTVWLFTDVLVIKGA